MQRIGVLSHSNFGRDRSTDELSGVVQVAALPRTATVAALAGDTKHGWLDSAIAKLGPNEFRRRLLHYAPGVLALLAAAIPYYEPVPFYILFGAALFALGLALVATRHQHLFCR